MAVEIGVFREAQLLRRRDEGGGDGVMVAHIGDAERAALAVQFVGAAIATYCPDQVGVLQAAAR
jgi:hypothetical protein